MELKLISYDKNNLKSIDLGDNVIIDRDRLTMIAGPCSVESREQILRTAEYLKSLDIKIMRGGAFKPRSSPYSFQGLGFEGLKYLREAGDKYNIKIVSEIIDPRDVEKAYDYVDIFQIGSRNMQNYSLIREIGKVDKPVLLKRGMNATISEWLMSAEYIALEGNDDIILCERGIRTFENYTRNTLDLAGVAVAKELSRLPVIVDPSHGTGRRELIEPMSRAAITLADGLMIEMHENPDKAISDGFQSLNFTQMKELVTRIRKLHDLLAK
ncbi:3-deoxy-7-phosphoheptulonate synthase [Clostridiaceae bacterium M8S5]|nr:3-deoxy-7-phosphoheptulonate synthase [Clostridiaceae bacterium M8S5]